MLDEWELFEEKRRTTRLDIIKQQLFNNGLRNNEPNQYGLIAQPVRAHA